jgi:hypothetical protein
VSVCFRECQMVDLAPGVGSVVPTARGDFLAALTRQWNWRAIVGGPSGTGSNDTARVTKG